MGTKLYLNILWHMHQPFYKDDAEQEYKLPYVRFHAVKDYYDMAYRLKKYPNIKQTFNFVPSLIDQLNDYAENFENIKENILYLSRKNAADLNSKERVEILKEFFKINYQTVIKRFPHYRELYFKLDQFKKKNRIEEALEVFSNSDFRDLQVFYNLAWIDPIFYDEEPLKSILKKQRNFWEEDKKKIFRFQHEIIKKIIPLYKEMQNSGQIEISISPYYHPILPLLIDTNEAVNSKPEVSLPENRYQYPIDADTQVKKALEKYKSIFGKEADGMWPSEGSVSDKTLKLLAENNIKWFATDEMILEKSLKTSFTHDRYGYVKEADLLCKPYRFNPDKDLEITGFFRDHKLSDLIGFDYTQKDSIWAAEDLMLRINTIADKFSEDHPGVLSIILDGENCWEYYENDGDIFLEHFYSLLNESDKVKTALPSEILEMNKDFPKLKSIFPGSWINRNYDIWIGENAKNKGWDYLYKTRQFVENYFVSNPDKLSLKERVMEQIYMAEGSDWFWWYGGTNYTEDYLTFDYLFRKHLKNVYIILDEKTPDYLDNIIVSSFKEPFSPPYRLIEPTIDGTITSFYDWSNAGYFECKSFGGSMHEAVEHFEYFRFGFDLENFYFMIMPSDKKALKEIDFKIKLVFYGKDNEKKEIIFPNENSNMKYAFSDVIEMSLPLSEIEELGSDIELRMKYYINGEKKDTYPHFRKIPFKYPDKNYDLYFWNV